MSNYLVYRIDNMITGEYYHGYCKNDYNWTSYSWSSRKILYQATKKYGRENFKKVVLSYHETVEDAKAEEINVINHKDPKSYNVDPGGGKRSSATRAKMSESQSGYQDNRLGAGDKNDTKVLKRLCKKDCKCLQDAILSVFKTRGTAQMRLSKYLKFHDIPVIKASWKPEHLAKLKQLIAEGYVRVF